MQCPACRHENPGQATFCLECGARFVVSCSNCGTELPPSAKFCLECGADRAVMLARGRGECGNDAWALRLLGDIASHHARPDVATAAGHYGSAMTLASELEMRPLVAHCHVGLGRLYGRTGDLTQAQEPLITATAMYGEMGMTHWLEEFEKGVNPLG